MSKKTCNDGETPTKRSKYNLRSHSTIFVELNDDCLNEIFRHLNVLDLCTVPQVCDRLKQLSESYFSMRHSKNDFQSFLKCYGRYGQPVEFERKLLKNLLIQFGPVSKSTGLSLSGDVLDDQTIDAIVEMKYLEELSLRRMIGLENEHVIKFAK